jgi:hypothetical protein
MEGDCGENSNLGLGENAIYFLRLLTPGAGSYLTVSYRGKCWAFTQNPTWFAYMYEEMNNRRSPIEAVRPGTIAVFFDITSVRLTHLLAYVRVMFELMYAMCQLVTA